jgi:triacylglycerol lipase
MSEASLSKDKEAAMTDVIVLAHGVFGFGNPLGLPAFANYFNGVSAHLQKLGHDVLVPQVNPFGSIAQRGDNLATFIQRHTSPSQNVHVIAHSMGGLDARHAITNVFKSPKPVGTLVTIGTPHRGSPVADALCSGTDPLAAHLPALLLKPLERNAGALHELTTDFGRHFDEMTPDVEGVRYIQVAGDASKGTHELFLFQFASIIGRMKREANDGLVTESSAIRSSKDWERLEDWPVDHAGEVGWSLDTPLPIEVELPFLSPPAHFARYEAIVKML